VVAAADRDGVWHATGSALALTVLAPFYARAWFLALVLTTLAAALVITGQRRRLARERRRAADQEFSRRSSRARSRSVRGSHANCTTASARSCSWCGTGRSWRSVPPGCRGRRASTLTQLSDIVASSLTGLRELAHNLTPHQLEHLGLSAALRAMLEAAAGAADVRFDVVIDDVDDALPHDAQLNVYRVLQEAIANIVRHAGAASARIEVRRADASLRIRVSDDGRGFVVVRDDDGRPVGGFGLSGIAERVRILGGRLALWSQPGRGTRLEIVVPSA
jgi:signal transduction histidine kinase